MENGGIERARAALREPQGKARALGKDKQEDGTLCLLICTSRDHPLVYSRDKRRMRIERCSAIESICVGEWTQWLAQCGVASLLHSQCLNGQSRALLCFYFKLKINN